MDVMDWESTSTRLQVVSRYMEALTDARDRLIRDRAREGASLRTIAAEAKLSHTTVARILKQDQ